MKNANKTVKLFYKKANFQLFEKQFRGKWIKSGIIVSRLGVPFDAQDDKQEIFDISIFP